MGDRHRYGSLAMYGGKPTAVGGYDGRKAEQLRNKGWFELANAPR